MKELLKKIILIPVVISILFLFTGCYDVTGIEELAYVVALGLDINENNELELSVQIATSNSDSSNGSSNDSSGSTSQSKSSNITTVKCNSIDTGLALINNHISKRINLSHCQVILVSEELSKQGISSYIESLLNNSELRNDCSVIVTKCSTKDYINSVNPALEKQTARFYESTLNSAKYTGYTTNITLFEFYSKIKDTCSQAYAIEGSILSDSQLDLPTEPNANYFAGNAPITDKDIIDNLGIAVFKEDKLVGELTGLDSICHIIINNKLKSCTLTIPSNESETGLVDIQITSEKKSKVSVSINRKYSQNFIGRLLNCPRNLYE